MGQRAGGRLVVLCNGGARPLKIRERLSAGRRLGLGLILRRISDACRMARRRVEQRAASAMRYFSALFADRRLYRAGVAGKARSIAPPRWSRPARWCSREWPSSADWAGIVVISAGVFLATGGARGPPGMIVPAAISACGKDG